MILRLVYSLFFFSLVTGNRRLDDTQSAPFCDDNTCVSPDKLDEDLGNDSSSSSLDYSDAVLSRNAPVLTPEPNTDEGHHEPEPTNYVSSYPVKPETKAYENVSNDKFRQPVTSAQYPEEDSDEKTVCFTTKMVQRMVKLALEYVSEIPSDINNIVSKLEQELNKMPDTDSLEEFGIKSRMYPIDSKTILQPLNKPKSKTRANYILKYEIPSTQEHQCDDALENLIELAYNAQKEIKHHPQCREYLYKYASHQTDERPKGHVNQSPDVKSIIGSLLGQADKILVKPTQKYKRPDQSYNLDEFDVTVSDFAKNRDRMQLQKIREIHMPFNYDINMPKTKHHPLINEYKFQENRNPTGDGYIVKKITEKKIPQIHEINLGQVQNNPIPLPHKGRDVSVNFDSINFEPQEIVEVLRQLLDGNNNPDNWPLFDRFMNLVQNHRNHFNPKTYDSLLTLLDVRKKRKIPRLNDILLLILDAERKKKWPSGSRITDILPYVLPDQTGYVHPKIVDVILNLYRKPTNDKNVEPILYLVKLIKEGKFNPKIENIIFKLIDAIQSDSLLPEDVNILVGILKPNLNGNNVKEIDIVDTLSRWDEIGLSPKRLHPLLKILKLYLQGRVDPKIVDIIHFLVTKDKNLNPVHYDFILSFLNPDENGIPTRRIDIIHFLLNNLEHPKHRSIQLQMLQDNAPEVSNSRFMKTLLYLNKNGLLSPELMETLVTLLKNDISGQLDDKQLMSLLTQLGPLKQKNPQLLPEILNIINDDGELLLKTSHNNGAITISESSPNILSAKLFDGPMSSNLQYSLMDKVNNLNAPYDQSQYRTPDDGYKVDNNFKDMFKWLDTEGLLNPDHGSNAELVNNLIKIVNMGDERELGVVELTYMLKHEKPVIYQPVYYVKYRLPILTFISNMKDILTQNPQLTSEPMKLLQELIVISNVTEVSPNLQGYPKEEILKLTVNDGNLVQAKILDEGNLNLNEQIIQVHELNADISPEELLQLNRVNEAKYYPSVIEFRGNYPEKVTMHEDKKLKFPTIQYHPVHKLPIKQHHPDHVLNRNTIDPIKDPHNIKDVERRSF